MFLRILLVTLTFTSNMLMSSTYASTLEVNPVSATSSSRSDEFPGIVGIYYFVRHSLGSWKTGKVWGKALGGTYESKDEQRMALHARWLECTGIDYILVDWSNNMDYHYPDEGGEQGHLKGLEDATIKLFEVLNKIGSKLKVALMIGAAWGDVSKIQRKIETINTYILNKPENRKRYFHYKGAPLLVKYQTPQGGSSPPEHMDCAPGFTLRSMSAFLTDQVMPDKEGVGFSSHWSWEDRGDGISDYVISVDPNHSSVYEATVVTPACRGDPDHPYGGCSNPSHPWLCPRAQGRQNGAFLTKRVDNAIKSKVPMMLVGTFNEFESPNENENPELSKDFEPSEELGFDPLEQLKNEVVRYKNALGAKARTCAFEMV